MKKRVHITDLPPLKESYQVPEGYFDSLAEKIEAGKSSITPWMHVEDVAPLAESYQVPEGYFDGLQEKIEQRKEAEGQVVSFRRKRVRIWASFVAAACIAMVVVSVIRIDTGEPAETIAQVVNKNDYTLKNIPDHEIASLLDERDDEFELTDEEIMEVIEHEAIQSESTAIIDFLQEDGSLNEVSSEEDFIESI